MTPLQMVREFHRAFKLPLDLKWPSWNERVLRRTLIHEEYREVLIELDLYQDVRMINLAQELADLVYVLYGTAASFGIDLDRAIELVHEANMSKLVEGKAVFREDGKVLKGPHYKAPSLVETVPKWYRNCV